MWSVVLVVVIALIVAILALTLKNILEIVMKTQEAIDDLKLKVEAQTTVIQSAKELLGGLAQQIRDNADDPAELKALADVLDANTTGLSQAVKDNTQSAA